MLRPRRKAAGEVFQVFTLEAGMIPGRIPFWKAAHIAQVLRRHVYCHVLGPAPHLPSAGVFLVCKAWNRLPTVLSRCNLIVP